jgi:hypothetical protein
MDHQIKLAAIEPSRELARKDYVCKLAFSEIAPFYCPLKPSKGATFLVNPELRFDREIACIVSAKTGARNC